MGNLGEDGGVSLARIPPSSVEPPPPDTEPHAPPDHTYSESDLDKLLNLLEGSADDWQTSVDGQGSALSFLAKGWESMLQRQQEHAWHLCKNRLTRLRFIQDEEGQRRTFERIMALNDEPDVRLAAAVCPPMYEGYQIEAEEPVYERVGGWLRDYMTCVKHSQIPLAFHFWMGVLALSASARRNVYIELGGSRLWMDQYIFLVGRKGSGKSDAMRYAEEVLRRMNDQLWSLDSKDKKEERYEWRVNFLPEDSGREHIINELEAIGKRRVRDADLNETGEPVDATGLLLIDEMSVHYGQDNWGVSGKTPFYTSIAGRDHFVKGTVKRGRQEVRNMLFSMAGCSAPEWMRDVVTPHVLKGGFVDRVLYIYRSHTHRCYSPFDRPIIDPLMMEHLAAQLTHWAIPPLGMKRPAEFTTHAKDWMRERYKEDRMREIKALDEGHPMEERASLVRSTNQVSRLAVALSMSEAMFPTVDTGHLELAIAVLGVEDKYFAQFLGEVHRDKQADNLDKIKDQFRKCNWEIEGKALGQKLKNIKGLRLKKDREPYMNTLLANEDIMKDVRSGKGGRSVLWYVWIGEK
jgi:hypothetical protein